MKCPLSNYVMERESGEDEVLLSDCLKEECAWWDKEAESCAMPTISARLGTVCDDLCEIIAKMPHEEQFRR